MSGSLNYLVYFYLFVLLIIINMACYNKIIKNDRIKTIDPNEIGDDIENPHINNICNK